MIDFLNTDESKTHQERIQKYYQFHAFLYDLSRWSFLFGRRSLTGLIADITSPSRILEIGCGTGYHLKRLSDQFPDSTITGIDVSADMLEIAHSKTQKSSNIVLKNKRYDTKHTLNKPFDTILLSYSLTMMGADTESILNQVYEDLMPGGIIAVVDFNTTSVLPFKRWMELNHVDFSGTALHTLKSRFTPLRIHNRTAYLGLWTYYQFIGQKQR